VLTMTLRRNVVCLVLSLLLLATAPACLAAHYTLSNGDVSFQIPDGWPRIMKSLGDPEMQVFRVPDASATGQQALARITVSSRRVHNLAEFQATINNETTSAQSLPHYKLDSG